MEEVKKEEATPHNPVAEETPQVNEAPEEAPQVEETPKEISADELAELKKRAEVSSQNFERAKKAEEKAKELEERLKDTEVLSEEDDDDRDLKSEVTQLRNSVAKRELIDKYPEVGEVWEDFESFRKDPEQQGMSLEAAAKVFRVEKGLADKPRKGLEKATGGDKVIISNNKMTVEEAAKLRNTDFKKYREMVKQGRIKLS